MEEITIILIPIGIIFTLLTLYYPKRKLVSGMIALFIWLPLSAVVATEAPPTNYFFWLFLGLAIFMFFWIFVIVLEALTGRIIIGRE